MEEHEVLELYWKLIDAPTDKDDRMDLSIASKQMVGGIPIEGIVVDREAGILMAKFPKGEKFRGIDFRNDN